MGIPRFYHWIYSRYPCIAQKLVGENFPLFDCFYIDMNSIIHQNSYSSHKRENISDLVRFQRIGAKLDNLFRLVKPQRLIYLAVDGAAPAAKLSQQRKRRFCSSLSSPENSEFDSNCISPGTEYMQKLDDYLKYFIANKMKSDSFWQKLSVMYSGYNVPGEGEHKIMDFIRKSISNNQDFKDLTHIIHGNDADLILLGLCVKLDKFAVFREVADFKCPDKYETKIIYLSILKEYINEEFKCLESLLPFKYDINSIVDDWILLSFLVGNDFLPNIPFLHINHNVFSLLWTTYKLVLPKMDGYLVDSGNICLLRLKRYLSELQKYEILHFQNSIRDIKRPNHKTTTIDSSLLSIAFRCSYDGDMTKMNGGDLNYPIGDSSLFSKCEMGPEFTESSDGSISDDSSSPQMEQYCTETDEFKSFKASYYYHKLRQEDECLMNICEEYIRGLSWTLKYYLSGLPSWEWFYPYHYSPFLSDIVQHMPLTVSFDIGEPLTPIFQLACILPIKSFHLLPLCIQDYLNSTECSIAELYPINFEVDQNGKLADYESVVLIPFPEIKRIVTTLSPFLTSFSSVEKNRYSFDMPSHYTYDVDSSTTVSLNYMIDSSFPPLTSIHVKIQKTNELHSFRINENNLGFFSLFPSLKNISFKTLMNYKSERSRCTAVVETRLDKRTASLDELIKLTVHQSYAFYPFYFRCKILEVCDFKTKYSLKMKCKRESHEVSVSSKDLSQIQINALQKAAERYRSLYKSNYNIVLPTVTHFYKIKLSLGYKLQISNKKLSVTPVWSEFSEYIPADIAYFYESNTKAPRSQIQFNKILAPSDKVVCISPDLFGRIGTVVKKSAGLATLKLENEPIKQLQELNFSTKTLYGTFYSSTASEEALGITKRLLSRVTGSIFISHRPKNSTRLFLKTNIGLSLHKYGHTSCGTFGFTKVMNGKCYYSINSLKLIHKYFTRFPTISHVFDAFPSYEDTMDKDFFNTIDPNLNLEEISEWLTENVPQNIVCTKNPCQFVDTDYLQTLESLKLNLIDEEQTVTQDLAFLYIPVLFSTNMLCDIKVLHNLLDIVVCIKYSSAIYLKYGVVTGFYSCSAGDCFETKNFDHFNQYCEDMVEVLAFDDTTEGVSTRGTCSNYHLIPSKWLLNITQGRNGILSFAPSSWIQTVNYNKFTPCDVLPELNIKTDESPSDAFKQFIHTLALDTQKEPEYCLDIEVKCGNRDIVDVLQKYVHDHFKSYPVFTIGLFQNMYTCTVSVNGHSFKGCYSTDEHVAKRNSAYIAYYTLISDEPPLSNPVKLPEIEVKTVRRSIRKRNKY